MDNVMNEALGAAITLLNIPDTNNLNIELSDDKVFKLLDKILEKIPSSVTEDHTEPSILIKIFNSATPSAREYLLKNANSKLILQVKGNIKFQSERETLFNMLTTNKPLPVLKDGWSTLSTGNILGYFADMLSKKQLFAVLSNSKLNNDFLYTFYHLQHPPEPPNNNYFAPITLKINLS